MCAVLSNMFVTVLCSSCLSSSYTGPAPSSGLLLATLLDVVLVFVLLCPCQEAVTSAELQMLFHYISVCDLPFALFELPDKSVLDR